MDLSYNVEVDSLYGLYHKLVRGVLVFWIPKVCINRKSNNNRLNKRDRKLTLMYLFYVNIFNMLLLPIIAGRFVKTPLYLFQRIENSKAMWHDDNIHTRELISF